MNSSYELGVLRIALCDQQPYLATAAYSLIPIETEAISTMGVDKHFRLYYNPKFLTAFPRDQLVTVLIHELSHVLRGHHDRMSTYENFRLVNVCQDAEINDDLVAEGHVFPELPPCKEHKVAFKGIFPGDYGLPDGQMAEWYYSHWPEQPPSSGSGDGDGECQHGPDCGSGADGRDRPWEQGGPSDACPGHDSFTQDMIRRKTAEDIQSYAKQAGTVPGSWQQFADSMLSPKVDWRKQLSALVRNAVSSVSGAVDYSYRRPSRRHPGSDVVFPSLIRPVPSVAIVTDTSGSMTGEINEMMAEVGGILKHAVKDNGVPVIACDADVQWVGKVFKASQIQLRGGGGTQLEAGIKKAESLSPRPQVLVVCTDGYCSWDYQPRGMKVIVALIGKDAPEGPAWAKSVRVV